MRIIIDLQACQSGSRYRGIGRYSLSLARSMLAILSSSSHEVIVVLNASMNEEADLVEAELGSISSSIKFFRISVLVPCAAKDPGNAWRQMASRLLREHAIASLEPDIVHVATLLADGWQDNTVASIGSFTNIHIPTVLTHYDLIPLVMSEIYMPKTSPFNHYYMEKLKNVQRADLLLAISDYSRQEALEWLGRKTDSVVNISSAVADDFAANSGKNQDSQQTLDKHKIPHNFLLYAPGGFDARKNLNCLLKAYSLLSHELRSKHRLVIASEADEALREGLMWKASTFGLSSDDIIMTGYVPNHELIDLYKACGAYVFPSLHEGFGLPVLEAMACGAVVIASNCTSIPEAHGLPDALFDPHDPISISNKMKLALTNETFRTRLKLHAAHQISLFSWDRSARIACKAIESLHERLTLKGWCRTLGRDLPSEDEMLRQLAGMDLIVSPNSTDLQAFRKCLHRNLRGTH